MWLSVFALMLLAMDTQRRIPVFFVDDKQHKRENVALYNRGLFNAFKQFILIITPFILLGVTSVTILNFDYFYYNPERFLIVEEMLVVITLVIMYTTGVIGTYNHYKWRQKNIPHLLVSQPEVQRNFDQPPRKPGSRHS